MSERFRIDRLAGAGGMGTVYRAIDETRGEPVALKILQREGAAEHTRFLREAQVLASLTHPGIVRYIDHGIAAGGAPYLAMEWLEGEDLDARLQRARLSIGDSLTIARAVAEALAGAHAAGVVHRDLKPSNIFLVSGELSRVKLLDFGIAHLADATRALTATGHILGTPSYMAPEQARGDQALDARADVFALGSVLFACLTGRPPFEGEHVLAVLAKVLFAEPPRLRELRADVPPAVEALVAQMLAKDPEQRPRDGAALAAEIAALGAAAIVLRPPPPSPPGLTSGEQRGVSVILVRPATAAEAAVEAATLTPEQLEAPLARLCAAAAPFGAHLERLHDGSVVAALAWPGSATDQAAQAARCALALREACPAAQMALATGRGMLQGKVPIGEAIDRVVALPGAVAGVRLDEVTRGLLDDRFAIAAEAAGPTLHAERAQRAETARLLLGKPTPCVGRDRELAVLHGLVAECVDEGVARAVLVTGPSGVGKSRVRYELLRALRRREEPLAIWRAAGDPMRAGSPFGLAAELLRDTVGAAFGDPLEVRRDKLRARVRARRLGAEAARVTAFLGEIMGSAFPDDESVELEAARQSPALMIEQVRRAWEDFLAAECAAQPVLIVIDDLHWGDPPSVQLLDAALRTQRTRPLLVLGLGRPEVHDAFPRLWAERAVQEVRLGELSPRASTRLVRQVLGEQTRTEVVERIAAQAGGNAFYLEELIRAEAEGHGAQAPGTVLAMVEARLMALGPEERRLIRAASVFGEVFWEAGARALLPDLAARAGEAAWMSALVDREIIVPRAESRLPGQREYAFRHALVRDGAYAMLTEADRALGHRLAGAWLLEAGEEDRTALAEHFERGGERARAAPLYAAALEPALESGDIAAVMALTERAIACGAQGTTFGVVRTAQGETHAMRMETDLAVACFTEAMELLPRDHPCWFRAATAKAEIVSSPGEVASLVALAEELGRRDVTAQTSGPAVMAMASIAFVLVLLGASAAAAPLFERLEQARPWAEAHPMLAGHLHAAFATRALLEDDLVAVRAELAACLESFSRAGYRARVINHATQLGYADALLGANREAEQRLREALALAQRSGLAGNEMMARYHLGHLLLRTGAVEEAAVLCEGLLEQRPRAEGVAEILGWILRARIEARRGRAARAEEAAERGLEASTRAPYFRSACLTALAEVRLQGGRLPEARAAVEEALGLFPLGTTVTFDPEAMNRLIYAEALHGSGAVEEARAALALGQQQVLRRAAKMADPAVRRRYLEDVPEHARILKLAAEWRLD